MSGSLKGHLDSILGIALCAMPANSLKFELLHALNAADVDSREGCLEPQKAADLRARLARAVVMEPGEPSVVHYPSPLIPGASQTEMDDLARRVAALEVCERVRQALDRMREPEPMPPAPKTDAALLDELRRELGGGWVIQESGLSMRKGEVCVYDLSQGSPHYFLPTRLRAPNGPARVAAALRLLAGEGAAQ